MKRFGSRRAFTLVEILLVIAIIVVISAVTLPSFVRSISGNRLRTAGRTVVAVTRYARSMALLHQTEIEVAFVLNKSTILVASHDRNVAALQATGEVEVAVAEARARMAQTAASANSAMAPAVRETPEADGEYGAAPPLAAPEQLPEIHLTRVLDGVTIESVQLTQKNESDAPEGGVRILYRSNGRCDPYEVILRDHDQRTLRIKVDALPTPTVERERT